MQEVQTVQQPVQVVQQPVQQVVQQPVQVVQQPVQVQTVQAAPTMSYVQAPQMAMAYQPTMSYARPAVGIDINRDGIPDFALAQGQTVGVDVNRDGITDYVV